MAPHISNDDTTHHVLSNGNGNSNSTSNGNSSGNGVGFELRDDSLTRQHEQQYEPVEKTRKSALVTGMSIMTWDSNLLITDWGS